MIDKQRKCVACAMLKNRDELFRILKKYDTGEVIISPTKYDFGRSVYICKNKDCINKAFKKGRMARVIKQKDLESFKIKLEKFLID